MPDLWIIKKVLGFATDYFTKANIESPHLEAEILLANALNLKRIDLYIQFEKVLNEQELAKFKGFILRRKNHEPTAYITGTRSFMSLDLMVTKDVLIPRPETELLIETAMDMAKRFDIPKILDIGTGSGAIAISLAKYIPASKIHATDISDKAVKIASENAKAHNVLDRITFDSADLYPASGKFDIIVSNPPYIKSKDIAALAPEIKNFEPLSALDGGEDGLKFYRMIIPRAKEFLNDKGLLLLEIDPGLAEGIVKLIKEAGFSKIDVKKDLQDLDRVLIIEI
jgi:release factor glutamine methyltransferase